MFVLVKFIGVRNMAKQAKVLNEKEISKLFKVCDLTNYPVRNKLIVAFSFYGGLRAIEIANLNVSDILSPTNTVNDIILFFFFFKKK